MLRLLADENFNNDIVRGLLLRQSDLDLVRIQDVGLLGAADPDLLVWAATVNRILLSHDLATMAGFADERVAVGDRMPGVFLVSDRLPVGRAIQEILLMSQCSEQLEWLGKVIHLPL
ncbi:MAG: DUF5615 family PIN-like protein [Planctomycetaceae bacterium]|nr:DUF5615 family PIN-like protein [Planctomycetaceae bacterium]